MCDLGELARLIVPPTHFSTQPPPGVEVAADVAGASGVGTADVCQCLGVVMHHHCSPLLFLASCPCTCVVTLLGRRCFMFFFFRDFAFRVWCAHLQLLWVANL